MKPIRKKYPQKLEKLNQFLKRIRIPFRVSFILMGVASTIWFLVRVIPKPSRATYPCMRITAPIMSGFIVYILSIFSSALAFRLVKKHLKKYRFAPAALAFLVATASSIIFLGNNPFTARSGVMIPTAIHVANDPMGEGKGIFPGRVIWAWDADATNENCINTWKVKDDPSDDDGYFMPQNNDQDVIDSLFSVSIKKLTGTNSEAAAWTALFKYHNDKKGIGELDYATGEKIFIKINQGTAGWNINTSDLSVPTNYNANFYGVTETLPHLILAVLRELVYDKGVLQQFIYVGDPIAHIYRHTYEYLAAEFPDVKYFDKDGYTVLGRTQTAGITSDPVIQYSDGGEIMANAKTDKIYIEMEQAQYMINMACLKGHERAGITLTAKNHFGSHSRSSAAHLHPGLVWVDKNDWGGAYDLMRTDYGMYRVQVDIMGNKYLGGNTMLYMVDGFWGGPEATMKPVKWKMEPFNSDWPSSLFISLDQVALESVCFDFLRTEFTEANHPGLAFPNYPAADDYLQQAADPANWPEGITYQPDISGDPLTSLGIHEHWNNATDKQYSRNLGGKYGIELVTIPENLVVTFKNSLPTAKKFDTCKHIMHTGSKPVILYSNVTEMFTDPDDQELSYSVTSGNTEHLIASMQGDTAIIAKTGDDFTGSEELTIHVFDGLDTLHYQVLVDITSETHMEAANITPAITYDGIADDNIWKKMNWYYIDQVWMPYRASLEANDFSGRYKVAWSESENVLCFLVETTDDIFVDGYIYNSNPSVGGKYPDYDILEIFIDEDKSGGMHIFDNAGSNAENAFSYHMSINEPEDGGIVNELVVCDIAGISWSNYSIPNYASHFQDFIVRRTGNSLTWEFSLKVYDDTYDNGSPENSRVNLGKGKEIGFAMAYCDNDDPLEVPLARDNFIGTDVGPDEPLEIWNEHWQNADVYGTLELMSEIDNQPPVVEGSIDDLVISENNITYTAAENLNLVFTDPDEDRLVFSAETEDANLIVEIEDDSIARVTAQDGFSGSSTVTVMATDGLDTISLDFTVSAATSISEHNRLNNSIQVIPNPVGNTLRMNMENELFGTIEIAILDISGREINKYQVVKTDSFMYFSTDFSFAKHGIYILKVRQGNRVITKKIAH